MSPLFFLFLKGKDIDYRWMLVTVISAGETEICESTEKAAAATEGNQHGKRNATGMHEGRHRKKPQREQAATEKKNCR